MPLPSPHGWVYGVPGSGADRSGRRAPAKNAGNRSKCELLHVGAKGGPLELVVDHIVWKNGLRIEWQL